MELQEKSVLAQEKPRYDAIPLTTFDEKTGRKLRIRVDGEDLRYRVISPRCMTFRLFIFWMLWTVLIIAITMSLLAHFWHILAPRVEHNRHTHRNINVTHRLQ